MSDKVEVKVSEVLEMLEKGKTREDIGKHYGFTKSDVAELFKHPSLKGKKTKKIKEKPFIIVDDTVENKKAAVKKEPKKKEKEEPKKEETISVTTEQLIYPPSKDEQEQVPEPKEKQAPESEQKEEPKSPWGKVEI